MAVKEPVAISASGKRIHGYNDKGQAICNASLAGKPGRHCQRIDTMDNGRCRLHNGGALSGPAHPMYETGKFSNIPGLIGQRINAARNDPALLELGANITAYQVLLEERLSEIAEGWDRDTLKKVLRGMTELSAKLNSSAPPKLSELRDSFNSLLLLMEGRCASLGKLSDLNELQETQRKLVETDQKRIVLAQQMVRQDELDVLFSVVDTLLLEEWGDPKGINEFWRRLRMIQMQGMSRSGVGLQEPQGANPVPTPKTILPSS